MSNTITSSMMGHEAPSIAQLSAREVADAIRYLGIGDSKLMVLIENSLFKDGKRKNSKALISKRSVSNVRYEMYTRSHRPYKFTVSSGTEITSTGLTMVSVNGLQIPMTLYNARTNSWCRLESVNTSTKVVKGSTFGSTTFSAQAGDVLLLGAPADKEGSTASMFINGSDDQNFNTIQLSRWGVSISWVLEATKQIAGGNRLSREKRYLLWEAMADIERTLIFGDYTADYATKNTTTGTQTGYTDEYPTTKGLRNLAANSGSALNNGDVAWIVEKLPEIMGEYVNDDDTQIALCSKKYYGKIVGEMQGKYEVNNSGELKPFGIKATELVTSGPNVQLVPHNAFNATPTLQKSMLLFAPGNVGYVSMEGHDLKPNNGIQTNATHGKQDEIYDYFGFETKDAGKTITWITDLY